LLIPHSVAPPQRGVISGSGYAAANVRLPAFRRSLLIFVQLLLSAFEKGASFILVILPERAEDVRNLVKHTGDVVLGVATQCVVSFARASIMFQATHLILSFRRKRIRWLAQIINIATISH
jgi:hypothetical protein